MTDDELTRQLQNLPRESEPPAAVRDVVRRAAAGSLKKPRRIYWQLGVAASLFAVAFLLGRSTAPAPNNVPRQREFVLLLYGGEPSGAPDDRVREYAAWASTMREQGRRVSGERLSDESWAVGANASDLPLRGFFTVQASSEDDARALAKTHPHARHGGGIVIRPVASAP
jgi:hypothetical protein